MNIEIQGKTEQEIIEHLHLEYWRNRFSDNAISLGLFKSHIQKVTGINESIIEKFAKIAFNVPKIAPLHEVRVTSKNLQITFSEILANFVGQTISSARYESEINHWRDEIGKHMKFIESHEGKA